LTRDQRIDLIQSRDPCIDLPVQKGGVREYHQFHVPGNVEVAFRGSDSHEVIVAFNWRARVAAIEVHTALVGAWQSAIIRTREWKHVHVIAVGRLAVEVVGWDRGSNGIQG
jgi:hypothetical protein